jgi:hypothetical protein
LAVITSAVLRERPIVAGSASSSIGAGASCRASIRDPPCPEYEPLDAHRVFFRELHKIEMLRRHRGIFFGSMPGSFKNSSRRSSISEPPIAE